MDICIQTLKCVSGMNKIAHSKGVDMLVRYNPDNYVTEIDRTICPFHQKFPMITDYPGCTCSMNISYRKATTSEKRKNIQRREKRFKERRKANREFGWPPVYFANLLEQSLAQHSDIWEEMAKR